MAGTSEWGNEPSGSIKCGEFLDYMKTGWILENDSVPWMEPFKNHGLPFVHFQGTNKF